MISIEKMIGEISRLYREEHLPFKMAREIVIRGSGINKTYWPELRTQLSSILGQRGGKKRKNKKLFSNWYIDMMIAQSLDVIMERRDEDLSDP
jgi:hypothetical protein